MTPDSPPPLPAAPPAPSLRRAVVAWAVILACVALQMWSVVRDKAAAAQERGSTVGFEVEMQARYLVGMNEALGPMLGGEPLRPQIEEAVNALRGASPDAAETERLAIVQAEVSSPQTAEATLGSLRTSTAATLRKLYAQPTERPAEAEAQALRGAHGWLGRLALTHGQPAGDPARALVLGEAKRTFLGTLVLGMLLVIALGVGLALLAWFGWRAATGRLHRVFAEKWQPLAASGGPVWIEAFAIYLGAVVVGGLLSEAAPPALQLWIAALSMLLGTAAALLWPLLAGVAKDGRRAGWTWRSDRGWLREVGAGVIGYLAGTPIILVGLVLASALNSLSPTDMSHPIMHTAQGPWPVLVGVFLLAAVWAPVTEELLFRGAFYAAWRRRWGVAVSALGSAVIFAAVHPQGWAAIPALGAVAVVLALIREWRGSLVASMTAHALNNGTLFVVMLLVMR